MKNYYLHFSTVALAATLFSSGCAKDKKSDKTPAAVSEAFAVAPAGLIAGKDTASIGITTENLNKEFLLQSSVMNQTPIAMSSGLRSRVVMFKDVGDSVVMLESPDGKTINDNFPTNIILAKFPILGREQDTIFFDFEKGMSQIFVSGDWYSYREGDVSYTDTFQTIDVNLSYLEDIKFEDERLIIRQISQIPTGLGSVSSVEVKYYLQPYAPSETFKPAMPAEFAKFGYFTTAGQYNDAGEAVAYATKFDTTKPIRFGVSANTPKEYQQAVIDGILYWNNALEGNPIEAVVAEPGVTAPNFDLNMVQWVDWDDAGFAYADAQSDPRTGEILHAQVFMTSVFAISGKNSARALLANLEASEGSKLTSESLGLAGFVKEPLCNHQQIAAITKQMLQDMVSRDLSDDQILEVSKDYVREVIAHEIGHTVGLRHNFAGSLAQSYNPQQREAVYNEYLKSGEVSWGVVPSSSVMEYQPFKDATLSGEIIESGKAALTYDEKVLASLYTDQSFELRELPAFCTDGDSYTDCKTFDIGRNPIESQNYYIKTNQQNFTNTLVNHHIAARRDDFTANLNSDVWVGQYYRDVTTIFEVLSQDFSLVQTRRFFDQIDEYNIAEVKAAERSLVNEALEAIQTETKITDLLPTAGYIDLAKVEADFRTRIEAASVMDDLQKGQAKADVKKLLAEVAKKTVQGEMNLLAMPAQLGDAAWSDQYLEYLETRTLAVALATEGSIAAEIEGEDGPQAIELPRFSYPLETRKAALQALSQDRGFKSYMVQAMRERARGKLSSIATDAFGESSLPTGYSGLDEAAALWWNEYQQMMGLL